MSNHTFHIPVMGIGFTIDTPLKVAQYGIDSCISLVDDLLIEKMREFHCKNENMPFEPISSKVEDYRAKRITAYMDAMHDIIQAQVRRMKEGSSAESIASLKKYIRMLEDAPLKKEYVNDLKTTLSNGEDDRVALAKIANHLSVGSIDVNIMTKMDRENYKGQTRLDQQYNDAHAALRGYANSKVSSSLVLSAGMNPRLYSYLEQFEDFYPDENFFLKKKVVLKVSDYRSALIQGKFLAKKGIWVSEYRIESGLNCGGHAFATDGYLMGPILQEFKEKREELIIAIFEVYHAALLSKQRYAPGSPMLVKFTAQGGVGTSEEHQFLLENYDLDSIGWGTPFLLVPEAVSVDEHTEDLLRQAKEKDLYLSNISPLMVPFNTLRGNTKDKEKDARIEQGKPGSPCLKKHAKLSKEFGEKALCMASREFQNLKLKELVSLNLSKQKYDQEYGKIVEKSCICVGLGTSALLKYDLDTKIEGKTVSVCPGPNLAYFSESVALEKMIGHIYGRTNVIVRTDRPNIFIKELSLYVDYLEKKVAELPKKLNLKKNKALEKFAKNLKNGIAFYTDLFMQKELDGSDWEFLQEQLVYWENRIEPVQQSILAEV